MAHVDITSHQHGLHGFSQIQQAQQVGGGTARAAHSLCSLLMGQAKLLDQTSKALRLFQRVQVFALNVLDQRHGSSSFIRDFAHQHRHLGQTCDMRGTKTALTGNDFVLARMLALAELAHQNRLHDALHLDAFGQFIQRAFIHARARLVLACHHHIERQCAGQISRSTAHSACFFFADLGAQQGFQTTSQALGFLSHHC